MDRLVVYLLLGTGLLAVLVGLFVRAQYASNLPPPRTPHVVSISEVSGAPLARVPVSHLVRDVAIFSMQPGQECHGGFVFSVRGNAYTQVMSPSTPAPLRCAGKHVFMEMPAAWVR